MISEHARELGNGIKIPYVGFGTYLIPGPEAEVAVDQAIRLGYRHIDTAESYKNEAGVGAGIKRTLHNGGVARGDLFVTTKLWPGNSAWGETPKTTATTSTSFTPRSTPSSGWLNGAASSLSTNRSGHARSA
jgi:2,5-diketo-D-gluconate reductase A